MKKQIRMRKPFEYTHHANLEITRPPTDRESKSGEIEFVFEEGKTYDVDDQDGNDIAFPKTTTLTVVRDGMSFEIPFPTSDIEYL